MHEWLAAASARIAQGVGDEASEYELSDADVERLELARVAAHESGERTNAPLACYLVLARGAGRVKTWRSLSTTL